MLRTIELLNGVTHLVVLHDVIDHRLVDVSIVNGEGDATGAEAASAPDSVEEILVVSLKLPFLVLLRRHIVVDHELGLWDVDTTRNYVCRDQDVDLAVAEPVHDLVALFILHLAEENVALMTVPLQDAVDMLGVVLRVHENEGLRCLASREDLLDEVKLLALSAAVLELLDVAQLQLLRLDFDLDSLLDVLRNALLHLLVLAYVLRGEGS